MSRLAQITAALKAGININPVAGLQPQMRWRMVAQALGRNQHQPSRGITTKIITGNQNVVSAGININPVAGLQQASEPRSNPQAAMPESTSTQSRDYNERNGYGREFLRCAGININPVTFIYWGLSEFLGDYKNFCNYSARS